MEKLLKFSLVLAIILVTFSSCQKQIKNENLKFKNLTYYVNNETYFSVKNGIYQNSQVYFEEMMIYFKGGRTRIVEGKMNLRELTIIPKPPLQVEIKNLLIDIKKDPIINLKKMMIEGYDVEIINKNKKEEKVVKAYKINIDLKENKIYTLQNRGVW